MFKCCKLIYNMMQIQTRLGTPSDTGGGVGGVIERLYIYIYICICTYTHIHIYTYYDYCYCYYCY